MADRQTVSQLVQIGVEATPGTGVPATRQLLTMSIEPSIKADVKAFSPMGLKYNVIDAEGKEWTEASTKGFGNYNEIVYPLSSVLTKTTPNLLATGAYQWIFSPSSSANDDPQTYTIEHGDPTVRADKYSYGLMTAYTLNFSRDSVEDSGTMIGQLLTDAITMTNLVVDQQQTITITGTPTGGTFTLTFAGATTAPIAFDALAAAVQTALEAVGTIGAGNVVVTGGPGPGTPWVATFQGALAGVNWAVMTANSAGLSGGVTPTAAVTITTPGTNGQLNIQPILGRQLDVFVDPTVSAIGTTKLTRAFTGQISVGDRYNPVWPINSANASFDGHVERKVRAEARLMVEADGSGMGFLSNLRAGSTAFMRLQATGPVITGGFAYQLQWDVALKVRTPSAYRDENGVYAIEWTFDMVHEPSWGRAQTVRVTNAVANL